MVMRQSGWVENRNLYVGISVLLHVLLLFYLKTSRTPITTPAITFREVSYIEESPRARYRNPKVKKILQRSQPSPSPSETPKKPDLPAAPLKPNLPEPRLELSAPKLDLSASAKPDLTPATTPQIDLSSGLTDVDVGVRVDAGDLDLSTGLEGADVIISSGSASGTREILSRPEVKPSLDLSSGLGQGGTPLAGGGAGGGEPGITLEPVGGGPQIQAPTPPQPPAPPPSDILDRPASRSSEPTMQVSGQIANRKILRRVRPRYPARALREGREGTVQVKFWVAPDGRVRPNVVVIRSSGSPDLDQAVIQAVRQWRFAPLDTREDQWGVLTVVFRLL